jgi:hypothetical protein
MMISIWVAHDISFFFDGARTFVLAIHVLYFRIQLTRPQKLNPD